MYNSYPKNDEEPKKHVKLLPNEDASVDASILLSHTLRKLQVEESKEFCFRAHIAAHASEDSFRFGPKFDCTMSLLLVLCISLALPFKTVWVVASAAVKSAFLETDKSGRNVYVRLSLESKVLCQYWILLDAVNGSVICNANFQTQANELDSRLGLSTVPVVALLSYPKQYEKLFNCLPKLLAVCSVQVSKLIEEKCFRHFAIKL